MLKAFKFSQYFGKFITTLIFIKDASFDFYDNFYFLIYPWRISIVTSYIFAQNKTR